MNQTDNYIKLKKFSPRYLHYAYVDTEENFADQIFISHKIRVRFGDEFIKKDSPYKIVFCKILKKDESEFLTALSELNSKMLLLGYNDYASFCKDLKTQLFDSIAEQRKSKK